MLRHTFCHIPGVGRKTEAALWNAGILSWDDVLHGHVEVLSPRRTPTLRRHVEESLDALDRQDVDYFYRRLPTGEHWRLFADFRHLIAYLDIETTGMGGPDDYVTVIGVYDGRRLHHYVQGENMVQFAPDMASFGLLVTYNGKCFDLPFIRTFMNVELTQPHIDLMFVLRALGYTGGLKGCEHQLGIDRGGLEGVDGYFAVLLWNEYLHRGETAALETLLAYNSQDVVNLENLMVQAYNLKLRGTPVAQSHQLPDPAPAKVRHRPDDALIRRIRHQLGWI